MQQSLDAAFAWRPSSLACYPRCDRLELLPTAILELIFEYFTHDDAVSIAVCSLEWPHVRLFDLQTIRALWCRPILEVAVLQKAAACGCWRAAASVSSQVPKWLKAELYPSWVIYDAVRRGDMTTIEQLHLKTLYQPHVAMELAGRLGKLELVEWLYHHSRSAKSPSVTTAVIDLLGGREETASLGFEYVNWNVHLRSAKISSSSRFCASREGFLPHLPVLATSQKQRYPLLAYAVSVGAFALVESLLQRGVSDSSPTSFEHTLSLAAGNGNLEVVRWLLAEHKSSLDEIPQAMVSAAQQGHADVLDFLYETVNAHGPSITLNLRDQEQLRGAALHGHLEVVEYLVRRCRVDVTTQVFDNAARQGHKHVVLWLADHSGGETILPLTIMRAAVCGGNVELVRWLVEKRRCPMYREAVVHAAEENRLGVLKWLHQYAREQAGMDGRPTPQHILDYDSISLAALRCQGSIDCATWLIETVPWVDPNYSARDLRSVERWYETAMRKELGILHRNEPPLLDQHRLSDVSVAQRGAIDRFLIALIRHRPQTAVFIKWLPRWAVWTRSLEALERLSTMNHRYLRTARTLRTALVFSTDARLVTWLLRHAHAAFDGDEILRQRELQNVRKWANKHGRVDVLLEMRENGVQTTSIHTT